MTLKKTILYIALYWPLLFSGASVLLLGDDGKVTIEKEGEPPTPEELESMRTAISDEYAVVEASPSVKHIGFRPNPVVNAAASVTAYREDGAPPYYFHMFPQKRYSQGGKKKGSVPKN